MSKNAHSFPSARLKDVAPAAQAERAADNREVWHLNLEAVESDTGRILKRDTCRAGDLKPSKVWFNESNVLYSKLRPYLNKVVVPEGTGAATSELIPLQPDPFRLDREFLAYYLRGPKFVDFTSRITQGANLPRVSMKEFWTHEIPIPPLEEQRRIVGRIQDCLSRVEEMERLQAEVAADAEAAEKSFLRELEKSVLEDAIPVGTVLEQTRNGRSPEAKRKNHNCSVLTLTAVQKVTVDHSYHKGIELDDQEQAKFRISKGDVYISRANTLELVGLSSFVSGEVGEVITFPDLLIQLTPDQTKIRPEYLALCLRFPNSRKQIQDRAIGSSRSMVKISGARLKEVKVPLPPLEQQKSIFEKYLRFSERTAELKDFASTDFANLRNAILRQAFAGEL